MPCRQDYAPTVQETCPEKLSVHLLATCSFVPRFDFGRPHNYNLLCLKIDLRNGRVIERQHHGFAATDRHDLDNIAGAEIMQRVHGADLSALRSNGIKPNQVGVIESVVLVNLGSRVRGT